MRIIGLTGPLASGKSTVAAMFIEMGIPVLCADTLIREIQEKNTHAAKEVAAFIGEDVLASNGGLNREVLRKKVGRNEELLDQVSAIYHPLLEEHIYKEILHFQERSDEMGKPKFLVLDIPLLFGSRYEATCEKTIVCSAPRPVRLNRALKRPHMTEELFTFLSSKQMPLSEQEERADFALDTNKPLSEINEDLKEILEQLKKQS